MTESETTPSSEWTSDFDAVREERLRREMASTPAQRLALLEELIEFARRAGSLPRPAKDEGRPSGS